MKAQRTTTTRTIVRRQAARVAFRLFDAGTLVVGLVLAVGGLAVLSTTSYTTPQGDPAALLACAALACGLVLLTALVGGRVWFHGVLAAAVTSCRVLIVVAAGLALLGIWADVPTPQSWGQDVMTWQTLGVLTLLLGLSELPGLLTLPSARAPWQRELIGLHMLTAWLPFSWLLLFYPTTPVGAGSRDRVHQVLPELLFLAVIALTCLLQILIRWHWLRLAARETPALSAACDEVEDLPPLIPVQVWLLEDGDDEVGIDLGRLPEIYGDWITHDLPAALWSIPAGVVVRVGYTRPPTTRYVVEGSITEFRDGGVVIDGWWIGGDEIVLTGLVILDDPRSPLTCAHTRTPLLLAAPSAGQSGQPTSTAGMPSETAVPTSSQASTEATPQASAEATPRAGAEASARTDQGHLPRPTPDRDGVSVSATIRRTSALREAAFHGFSDQDRTVSIKDPELDEKRADRD